MLLEDLSNWIIKRRKYKFRRILTEQLNPIWLFDKGNYIWFLPNNRRITIMRDQLGNYMVYDDSRKVSDYLKSKDECITFALDYIITEIISKFYPKFNL